MDLQKLPYHMTNEVCFVPVVQLAHMGKKLVSQDVQNVRYSLRARKGCDVLECCFAIKDLTGVMDRWDESINICTKLVHIEQASLDDCLIRLHAKRAH